MTKATANKAQFYLVLLILTTSLTACRSSSPVGVVSNYHWNNDYLQTNNQKLKRHSRTINQITIHHTATKNKAGESDLRKLRSARRYHMEDRGWGDIAYHFLIAPDGTIYQGRSSEYIGGSSTDYGTDNNLLIALMGNFEVERPTVQAVESLKKLVVNRLRFYGISPSKVTTHRHHTATLCPGANLEHWFSNTGKYEINNSYMRNR